MGTENIAPEVRNLKQMLQHQEGGAAGACLVRAIFNSIEEFSTLIAWNNQAGRNFLVT